MARFFSYTGEKREINPLRGARRVFSSWYLGEAAIAAADINLPLIVCMRGEWWGRRDFFFGPRDRFVEIIIMMIIDRGR